MTVGVESCSLDTSITDLATIFLEKGIDSIIVLDQGNAAGIIETRDIVRAFSSQDYQALKAQDILRENVPQVPPDIPLQAAAQIMLDQGVHTLYLMHHAGGIEYPAAKISRWHILRYLAAREDKELVDLGILAERSAPLETFIRRRDQSRRLTQE